MLNRWKIWHNYQKFSKILIWQLFGEGGCICVWRKWLIWTFQVTRAHTLVDKEQTSVHKSWLRCAAKTPEERVSILISLYPCGESSRRRKSPLSWGKWPTLRWTSRPGEWIMATSTCKLLNYRYLKFVAVSYRPLSGRKWREVLASPGLTE